MTFSRQTLAVFQNLLATTRVSVLDNNADVSFQQLIVARNELTEAIREISQPQ
jgi:hypothetical protein